MAIRIKKEGAWERYGMLVWFDRFDHLNRTGMTSVAFLTFFISMLGAAPFIYYVREFDPTLMDSAWAWVAFIVTYLLSILILQNVMWMFLRLVLWVLEEL